MVCKVKFALCSCHYPLLHSPVWHGWLLAASNPRQKDSALVLQRQFPIFTHQSLASDKPKPAAWGAHVNYDMANYGLGAMYKLWCKLVGIQLCKDSCNGQLQTLAIRYGTTKLSQARDICQLTLITSSFIRLRSIPIPHADPVRLSAASRAFGF